MWIFEIVLCLATTYQAFLSTTCVSWIIMLSISHRAILLTLTQKSSLNEMAWTGLKTKQHYYGLDTQVQCVRLLFSAGLRFLGPSMLSNSSGKLLTNCNVPCQNFGPDNYKISSNITLQHFYVSFVFGCFGHALCIELCVEVNLFLSFSTALMCG